MDEVRRPPEHPDYGRQMLDRADAAISSPHRLVSEHEAGIRQALDWLVGLNGRLQQECETRKSPPWHG